MISVVSYDDASYLRDAGNKLSGIIQTAARSQSNFGQPALTFRQEYIISFIRQSREFRHRVNIISPGTSSMERQTLSLISHYDGHH